MLKAVFFSVLGLYTHTNTVITEETHRCFHVYLSSIVTQNKSQDVNTVTGQSKPVNDIVCRRTGCDIDKISACITIF